MVSPFVGQVKRQLSTITGNLQGKGVHIWSYFPDPARSISYIPRIGLSDSTAYLHILPMQGRVLCKYVYMHANISAGSATISLALYKLGPDPIAYDRLPSTTDDLKIHNYSWLRITEVVVEEVASVPSLMRFKLPNEITLDPENGVYAVVFRSNRLGFGTLNLGSQLGTPEVVGSSPVNTIDFDNQETIAGLSMSISGQYLDTKISLVGKVETAPVAYPFLMLASELGDKALPF